MPGPSLQDAVSWLAAHADEAPALGAPLHPSKLGTKQHWDEVYEREVKMFKEIGGKQLGAAYQLITCFADQGEVWFGEDAADKMVEWVQEHVPQTDANLLDRQCSSRRKPARTKKLTDRASLFPYLWGAVGTGNGQLLFRLSEEGYTSLTGIDYSLSSIELAESILSSTTQHPKPSINFFVSDILSPDPDPRLTQKRWKVLLDKGTYDAICLSDQVDPKEGVRIGELYPKAVAGWLDEEAYLLITSCNWTRAELEKAFITPQTGLIFHSLVPRPSFSFGGSTGSSITTIAFQKKKTRA